MLRKTHLVRRKEEISNGSEISNRNLNLNLKTSGQKKKKKKGKLSQSKAALKKNDNKMKGMILNFILYRKIKNNLHLLYWESWGNLCKNSIRNSNIAYLC